MYSNTHLKSRETVPLIGFMLFSFFISYESRILCPTYGFKLAQRQGLSHRNEGGCCCISIESSFLSIQWTFFIAKCLFKGTVTWDFLVWGFLGNHLNPGPWFQPKNSFPVFAEFNELMVNSELLSASKQQKVVNFRASLCRK